MAPRERIIIDTDPGVDDILALLLAFSAKIEELEVVLISLTFGNVDVQNCLRNVVSLFHIIGREQEWRRASNRSAGFESLKNVKPIVAVGAVQPLVDQLIMADFFHGVDGLGGTHSTHPHLTPSETWKALFKRPAEPEEPSSSLHTSDIKKTSHEHHLFTPSTVPAHQEILRTLRDNDADTITIVAIGPVTNLALAASEDPVTFLRAKNVVIMGGAINVPGNMSPLAEFNTHADAVAAARLFALTSPNPASTMPPPRSPLLPPYPPAADLGPKRLKLTLFPLDITTRHVLLQSEYERVVEGLHAQGSPLAEWTSAFLDGMWGKEGGAGLALHDPLCVWYAMGVDGHGQPVEREVDEELDVGEEDEEARKWVVQRRVDVRVETTGQWTRGACITDRRGRRKKSEEIPGDGAGWLKTGLGNELRVGVRSPDEKGFGRFLAQRIFVD